MGESSDRPRASSDRARADAAKPASRALSRTCRLTGGRPGPPAPVRREACEEVLPPRCSEVLLPVSGWRLRCGEAEAAGWRLHGKVLSRCANCRAESPTPSTEAETTFSKVSVLRQISSKSASVA